MTVSDGRGEKIVGLFVVDSSSYTFSLDVSDQLDTCTATWTDVAADITESELWNVAAGTPPAAAFSLNSGCGYNVTTPSETRLSIPPANQLPWLAQVDGAQVRVDRIISRNGDISLDSDVERGSNVQIRFFYFFQVAQ